MKLKSDSLHFEINTGRYKPIAYIRNSYRENGTLAVNPDKSMLEKINNLRAKVKLEPIYIKNR
jgi:hypothetical protein